MNSNLPFIAGIPADRKLQSISSGHRPRTKTVLPPHSKPKAFVHALEAFYDFFGARIQFHARVGTMVADIASWT